MHKPDICGPDSIELIDRQSVPGAQSALLVLATSAYLYSNDLRAFHDQTKQVLLNLIANDIVLNDANGQQQVDALREFERMGGELSEKPRLPEQGYRLSNARR